MNLLRNYSLVITVLLLVIYLVLPTANVIRVFAMSANVQSTALEHGISQSLPCDDGPSTDEKHGSHCCDTHFCSCACHAPLGEGLRLKYSPVIVTQNFPESFWLLPQVCRPIFVPPQNLA